MLSSPLAFLRDRRRRGRPWRHLVVGMDANTQLPLSHFGVTGQATHELRPESGSRRQQAEHVMSFATELSLRAANTEDSSRHAAHGAWTWEGQTEERVRK